MTNKTTMMYLTAAIAAASASVAGATEFTAPGSKLGVGDSATVPMRVPYKPQVPVRITVTSIDEGSLADFTQYKVPPEAADTKPYYVHYTATALADGEIWGTGIGYTLAIDDRNEAHTSTLTDSKMSGARFDRCRDDTFKKGAGAGASYSGCRIFLINRNGSLKGFAYQEFETPYNKAPVVWVPGAVASSTPSGSDATLRVGH
jgi:hypothetical protein